MADQVERFFPGSEIVSGSKEVPRKMEVSRMIEADDGDWVRYSDYEKVTLRERKRVRKELQAAFDHILNTESKLPGLHDLFDCVFPGWQEGGETPDPRPGPLGDGPSFAHDVKPLEEELALAKEHPEYSIDVEAVSAALEEAKADAAKKGDEHEG